MSIDIAASLNERQRNALLSYYLGQYVPTSNNTDLKNRVQTPEDVYEYLLIDPLVSNAVPTTRVAQAMSSIQQYINGITMNMEPGYQTESLSQDVISNWKGGLSQYDIWASEVELDTYPENYIDPTLRQSQTTSFKELITDLNQNTINSDTAQQAVLNYLNKFEQVANLSIVSGYLDSKDQTKGRYYFLGKSTTSPAQYYWRSFDMSQNIDNVMSTSAWSEWFPMQTGINENALQGTPRLAYFNNRLYLFWFERTTGGNVEGNTDGSTYDIITAYSSYGDFNNKWSSPYAMMSLKPGDAPPDYSTDTNYYDHLFGSKSLRTVCLFNETNNTLTTSLFDGDSVSQSAMTGLSDFSLKIDYWFNVTIIASKSASDTNPSTLYTYLEHYGKHPNNVQALYFSQFTLDSVNLMTEYNHNDFGAMVQFPALYNDNFKITNFSDGTIKLDTYIPETVSTANIGDYKFYTGDCLDFSDNHHVMGDISLAILLSEDKSTASVTNTIINMIDENENTQGGAITTQYLWYNGFQSTNGPTTECNVTPPVQCINNIYDISNQLLNYYQPEIGSKIAISHLTERWSSNNIRTDDFIYADLPALATPPWTFSFYEGDKAWNTGTAIKSITQDNFIPENNSYIIEKSDFSTEELASQKIIYNFSFGYAEKNNHSVHYQYQVVLTKPDATPITPSLETSTDPELGTATFLCFDSATFPDKVSINNIRLNTLFAKELVNKASLSMQALLNWCTQLTLEPSIAGTTSTINDKTAVPMDFHGANGIYFWELFFHMPHLVAWRLAQEQQVSDALDWYHYIFDPSKKGENNTDIVGPDLNAKYPEPDYWSVRPLAESASGAQASAVWLTNDPDALASASPVHYQKAIFMAYVDTLMAAADASYRMLTNDGLSLARLQYSQVRDLLGPRPDSVIVNHWGSKALGELAANNNFGLADYELQITPLPAFPGQRGVADSVTTLDVFMAPVNAQLLHYWNTLDSRLYNLRHWLTIDGQPLHVPLYAPPVNPTVLMEQSVQGGSLISAATGIVATVPPYRFVTMLQSARAAVSTLSQFGQTLLSYSERQDAAGLQELDAQQVFSLSSYTLQLQQNAIDALDKNKVALDKSHDMAKERYDHYKNLYDKGNSSNENDAIQKLWDAKATYLSASPMMVAAGAANMVPNIFGLADGGAVWGAAIAASGEVLQISSQGLMMAVQGIETSAGYSRRSEEWQIQYQQADAEIAVIKAQLDALTVQRTGAVTALNLAQAQQDNLKTVLNFLTTRFTQSALYNWLCGQLSALYFQAYDATLSLCLSAEACWQYEMGDIITRFINTGTWNDNYRGLLVGETLQLNLQQMESAWLNRYTRRLEITKTVSLKEKVTDADWSALLSSGKVNFSLKESLFDGDYPGHYLRQIKSVTVSLPALVGPYQNVRMTLTQTGSRVLLKPDIDGVNYLNDPTKGSATNILTNPRANQQVAVSSGLNDTGLFSLNFGDDRYLPFEGTGVVSDWQIAFPNPSSNEQKALLASLNDVIIQVHYTAMYGGSNFEQAVSATL